MNMINIVAVPMHREGRKFVAIFFVIALILGLVWMPLFWAAMGITVWCYYFFRDPVRTVPQDQNVVLSPADGVVSLIETCVPPKDMGLGNAPLTRVSVFMNVFNCHINRAPIGGKVTNVTYHHGKFLNASLDKASIHNERNNVTYETDAGVKIGVVQIAGLVARRIVCFVKQGDHLGQGERFGLIRFGSRLDIYLPDGTYPVVGVGQTAVGGETPIAYIGNTQTPELKKTFKDI